MQPQTLHHSLLTPHSRIFVAGHRGMVGAAILRKLAVNDRTQAVIYALRHGWIRLTEEAEPQEVS